MALLDMLSDPMTQLGASLLAAQSPFAGVNIGSALLQTGQLQQAQKKEALAEQQAKLSQLVGTYKMLKDQDQQSQRNAYLTGQDYSPNPLLALHEQKLSQLLGSPMATPNQSVAPSLPPQSIAPQIQPSLASQTSPVVNPGYRDPATVQAVQQAQSAAPQKSATTMPALLKGAGISPEMAMLWSQTEKGTEQMMQRLAEVWGPRIVNNVMMQMQPNGQTKFLGGVVSGGSVPVVTGPNGLQAQPVAGLSDALASQEGAKVAATEAAKAPFTPLTVPFGNKQGMMTLADFIRGTGGNPTAPTPGAPATVTTTQPPRAGSGAAFMTQAPGEKVQEEDLAKYFANQYIKSQEAGQAAAASGAKYDRMEQLMQGINTTGATPIGMKVSSLARAVGVELDPTLPQKEAFQSLAGQLALELRNPAGGAGMPGAMSDNDLKFLKSMTPGMAQTPAGRALMFETKRKLLQRDREVAQLARSYYKQNGKMDQGWDQVLADFANSHPLFPQAEPVSNNTASEMDALVAKYRKPNGNP